MSTLSSLRRRQATKGSGGWKQAGLLQSQLILFNSRRKWGLLYSLATLSGILCVPGVLGEISLEQSVFAIIQNIALLPLISLLIATGMYILNDLVDADLDRANGKKRPIPSGMVSKRQAWVFVVFTNGLASLLAALTLNESSMLLVAPMMAIGIMYSAPNIALMDRFVVKTLSISVFYVVCALLGITSTYGTELAMESPGVPIFSMTLFGIMIFISSTLNDLGDVDGDRAARRRTMPVVLGTGGTIKVLCLLAFGAIVLSLIAYEMVGPLSVFMAASFFLLVIMRLRRIGREVESLNVDAARREHKKIFPMHMVLQLLLAVGAVMVL
jgi:4-hydroxybenzoate polyprenyltransferase